MKFNLLKGGLGLLPLLSVVYANQCDEIKKEFENIEINYCSVDNEGNATYLDLSGNNLTTLPDSIGNLKNLRYLDLEDNKLETLPESISNLENMNYLDLSKNNFSTLPDNVGNLKYLLALYLRDNYLTTLPDSIGNLKNLIVINLNNNNLTSLPESIGDLENLQELYIDENNLESLPDWIGNLKNLILIDSDNNNLTSLPESIGDLENLKQIYIRNNSLESLPESIGKLKNLGQLYSLRNNLKSLPESIGELENLVILTLQNNKIETLPESIAKLNKLRELRLENNNLKTLPNSINTFKSLRELYLDNNNLESIPENLNDITSLWILFFSGNKKLTEFPQVQFENLEYLNIVDTGIYEVPENLTKSTHGLTLYKNAVVVYLYNANKNKCLRTTGELDSTLTYGPCDNSDNTLWVVPNSFNGYFRSKINRNYCLNVNSDSVSLKECSDNNYIYGEGNFLKSGINPKYCIGSSKKNSKVVSLKDCDGNDPDQIWYFNLWDSNTVAKKEDTVSVYFYNVLKDQCIKSDGTSVTTGSCDLSDDGTLWDIPVSHEGQYRSKANPEQCLSIEEGVVRLSECNESTTLYRDGNLIKSPLSEEQCIKTSTTDNTLEYLEGCDDEQWDHVWFYNMWTPPTDAE